MPKPTPAAKPAIFIRCGLFTLAVALAAFFLATTALPARSQAPADVNYGLTPGEGFGQVDISQGNDLYGTIARVINIALGFLGIVAVGLILYAGFLWMTARGNEDQVKKAKALLRNAVIGLAIILSAWGIAAFVIRQLRGVASGGGVGAACSTSGDPNICAPYGSCDTGLFCSPSSCTCQSSSVGPLPGEQFTLQEIQTGHAGRTNRDDVFLCSLAQPRFNHWLNLQENARLDIKAIQIEDVNGPANNALAMAVESYNNTLRLERRDNTDPNQIADWPVYSRIEIQVPKSLVDTSNKPLADCTANNSLDNVGCVDRDTYFAWNFTTTDKQDEIDPNLTSAWPPLPGALEGYPNQNINRSLTFTLNFSENIDLASAVRTDNRLRPERVILEKVAGNTDASPGEAVPTEHFDVSLSSSGIRFNLNRAHQSSSGDGPYLEPYTWYRLTVRDIADLCRNPLAGSPVVWYFKTNGNIPGVSSVYPANNYQFACPNTESFIIFRTSMYDNMNSSCTVALENGGLVTAGSGLTGRTLTEHDPVPAGGEGEVVNPNNFCRRYDFLPASVELAPNATFTPAVNYRNPANRAETITEDWSFAVKPANECANAPYIYRVSPNEGPWGRCLTIEGNYFGPRANSADDAFMRLDLDSARNAIPATPAGQTLRNSWNQLNTGKGLPANIGAGSWFNTYLTGVVPTPAPPLQPPGTEGLADLKFSVARSITLGGQPQELKSNEVTFVAHMDEPPYNGPCLSRISPTSGAWGAPVTLSGTNFGARDSSSFVKFSNNTHTASITNWQSTSIQCSVPNSSQDGLVHVTTPQGISNGLPFDVANGRGSACQDSSTCTPPLVCSGGFCADPPTPRGFYITQVWPRDGCDGACLNAEIDLTASAAIRDSSAGGSVAVYKCLDDSCRRTEAGRQEMSIRVYRDDGRTAVFNLSLALNSSYRVVASGGASGLLPNSGNELLSQLNFDSNQDGTLDSYSWYFRTGARACAVERLEIDRPALTLYERGSSAELFVLPYGASDSCSSRGQLLDNRTGFTWKPCARTNGDINTECAADCQPPLVGNEPIIMVNSADPGDQRRNSVTPGKGSISGWRGLACVIYTPGNLKAGSDVTVLSPCTQDSDCSLAGNLCPGSTCNLTGVNFGRCTPVIKDFSPKSGQIGTWVTIDGCYFGNTPGQVLYDGAGDPVPFVLLGPSCGQTWTDRQIIAEVPSGVPISVPRSGTVRVKKAAREDGQTARKGSLLFTIDDTVHPGLCRANPNYGASNSNISLVGKNFGATRAPASDKVLFGVTEALNVISWTDAAPGAIIQVAVPNMATGTVPIIVRKGANESNSVDFRVIDSPGAVAPTIDPLSVATTTPSVVCPAIMPAVELNGILNFNSLTLGRVATNTPANFSVLQVAANESLSGEIIAQVLPGSKTKLWFIPDYNLNFGGEYKFVLLGGPAGLRSQSHGVLTANGLCSNAERCEIAFRVLPDISRTWAECQPAGMAIEPASRLYTCAGKNNCPGDADNGAAGHQQNYVATILAKNSQELQSPADYTWTIANQQIINYQDNSRSTTTGQTIMVLPLNGRTRIASQTIIGNKTFSAAATAEVFLCENPWPAFPDTPFSDTRAARPGAAPEKWTNFSTFYCRDRGAVGATDDLPSLGSVQEFTARQGVPEDFIKEIFLTQPYSKKCETGGQTCSQASDCASGSCVGKTDAIGIRVLKNPNHDTTSEWYKYQTFTKGSPQAVKVDDYNGLRDGRTIYVNAPNDSDREVEAGSIYTNIYLISMNDQAQPDTQNIFNQLVANWRFAANVSDPNNLDKLRRDTQRLADLRHLADLVETYANNHGAPPKLESGSYTKYLSVSVWPSWSANLASDLGATLPVDPLNTVNGPACREQEAAAGTCWNKSDKQFKCVAGSYIYQYQYSAATPPNFTLRANLEYQPGSWAMPAGSWGSVGGGLCANIKYGF